MIITMMMSTEWYKGYQNTRLKKQELLPIAWHPLRYWDWCMSEEENKETEKLWDNQDLFVSSDWIQNVWTPKKLKIKCLL